MLFEGENNNQKQPQNFIVFAQGKRLAPQLTLEQQGIRSSSTLYIKYKESENGECESSGIEAWIDPPVVAIDQVGKLNGNHDVSVPPKKKRAIEEGFSGSVLFG